MVMKRRRMAELLVKEALDGGLDPSSIVSIFSACKS
jgi:hypothetical protein